MRAEEESREERTGEDEPDELMDRRRIDIAQVHVVNGGEEVGAAQFASFPYM